jgi:hypothetical protein
MLHDMARLSSVSAFGSAEPVRPLVLREDYSRREIHDIFAPGTPFTPQAGTWGIVGIVEYALRDFVFIVTFGQQQGDHVFDEGITPEGVISWQSQPKQQLKHPQIRRLVEHDEEAHSVHLFLRTEEAAPDGGPRPYSYLGRLKYLTHDAEREKPVHFTWQLLDWPAPPGFLERIGLTLIDGESGAATGGSRAEAGGSASRGLPLSPPMAPRGTLVKRPVPVGRTRSGVSTPDFRSRKAPDYAKRDAANRELGRAGELLVLEHEKRELRRAGRDDLAKRVSHVAAIAGDGAGYDISSFTVDATPRFVEVKTTRGDEQTDFYLSANEVAASREHGGKYVLCRVYGFNMVTNSGHFFELSGPLEEAKIELHPVQYRARPGSARSR